MKATRLIWWFVGALTLVRLSMLGITDLEFDEAHYWMWSERLAPAYFSKGPGIAFAIRASTAIFGPTEFGVRFWTPILAAGTTLLLFYFGRRLFGDTAGLWAAVALNTAPIYNVGAVLMTTDCLSLFFWTAAMFTFWIACERSPQTAFYWPLTGLLVGLGSLCRYTNGLEILCIVLVLAFAPRLRHEFKKPGLWLLLICFAICMVPPIIWNAQHAWVTLAHLRTRGTLDEHIGFRPIEALKFFGEHFLFYSPLLFLALVWGVAGCFRRVNQQFKVLFLFWFGLPVFLIYFLVSMSRVATPNWDAVSFLGFGLLAVYFWRERLQASAALRKWGAATLLLGVFISMLALDTDLLRTFGFHFFRSDPSDRMRGWKSMTAEVEKLRTEMEGKLGEKLFLIADERHRASEISFYLRDKRLEGPGHPPVYITESQDLVNQFSFWPRYDAFVDAPSNNPPAQDEEYTEQKGINPFVGRSALFIRAKEGKYTPHNIRAAFASTELLGTIEVRRFGVFVRAWNVFLCRSYRTLPL